MLTLLLSINTLLLTVTFDKMITEEGEGEEKTRKKRKASLAFRIICM